MIYKDNGNFLEFPESSEKLCFLIDYGEKERRKN